VYPQPYPNVSTVATQTGSLLPAFRKRALSKGRRHPKPELGKAIQLGSHTVKMLAALRFDENPDRAHASQAKASGPNASRTVVKNHERIWQAAGQVKRAAFPGAKLGVFVLRGSPSDFDPRLAYIRDVTPERPAPLNLLLHLERNDELAKQERQQLKTAQPVQVDQRRRVRYEFKHGWIAKSPVRAPTLPGFPGRR